MRNDMSYTYPSAKFATAAMFVLALLTIVGITQFIAPPFSDEGTEISFKMENTRYSFPIQEAKN